MFADVSYFTNGKHYRHFSTKSYPYCFYIFSKYTFGRKYPSTLAVLAEYVKRWLFGQNTSIITYMYGYRPVRAHIPVRASPLYLGILVRAYIPVRA